MYSVSVILILLILSFLFSVILLITGKIFSAKTNENEIKLTDYENETMQDFGIQKTFNYGFFTYAILFLVYDAEILLLFPFAQALGTLKSFVFLQAVIFILILMLSLGYAMQKNLLRFR